MANTPRVFATDLDPNNNSGVHGVAAFILNGNTLTTEVDASGLTPNQMHLMHIHGSTSQASQFPTLAQDANHDGFVNDTEAETAIGPVVMSLTKSGLITSNETVQDFPTVGANGTLHFQQTYTLNANDPTQANILNELQSMQQQAVEIHGQNIPEQTGSPTLAYDPNMPVATGLLHEVTGTPLGLQVAADVSSGNASDLLALNPLDPFSAGHA